MRESYGPIADLVAPMLDNPKLSGGRNLAARCPLPDHDDSDPSFSMNIENGLWICGGCTRSGGLPGFLREMGYSRHRIDSLVEPVLPQIYKYKKRERRRRINRFREDHHECGLILPESLLGIYDWKPNDLVNDGFDSATLRGLDVGYDKKLDRIMFPVRDLYGSLAGFVGRSTIGVWPRYLVYRGRRRNSRGEFVGSDFGPQFDETFPAYKTIDSKRYVWNMHRVYPRMFLEDSPLIVVEGFKACIWLLQHGFWNTVALMGSSMSLTQHDAITRMSAHGIVLWLDNDDAGRKGTRKVGNWLKRSTDVYVCKMPQGAAQPDDLTELGLKDVFHRRLRFRKWMQENSAESCEPSQDEEQVQEKTAAVDEADEADEATSPTLIN